MDGCGNLFPTGNIFCSLFVLYPCFFVLIVLTFAFCSSCTTHTTPTCMLPAVFEPAIPAGDWPQTLALDRIYFKFKYYSGLKWLSKIPKIREFFFVFSCILYFIRTWFCVLVVLHFAFSFLLTTHNTNICAPRGIYFFWIPSLALPLFPCFFFILIVLPSVFSFTVQQHKHPAPCANYLYSLVVCTLSVIVSLSCLSCILPFFLLPTTHSTNIHTPGGIQTRYTSKPSAADPRLRQLGHWDSIPGPSSP
jgi:hypothetical protein